MPGIYDSDNDVFYEISSEQGDPTFSVGGYGYLNVYNRDFIFEYARVLSDASFHFKAFAPPVSTDHMQELIWNRTSCRRSFPQLISSGCEVRKRSFIRRTGLLPQWMGWNIQCCLPYTAIL